MDVKEVFEKFKKQIKISYPDIPRPSHCTVRTGLVYGATFVLYLPLLRLIIF